MFFDDDENKVIADFVSQCESNAKDAHAKTLIEELKTKLN
jgi:hypothetical protein